MLLHGRTKQYKVRAQQLSNQLKQIETNKNAKDIQAKREQVRKEVERRIHMEISCLQREQHRQNMAARKIQKFIRSKKPTIEDEFNIRQSLEHNLADITQFSQFMYLNFGENLKRSVIKIQRFIRFKIKTKGKFGLLQKAVRVFVAKAKKENAARDKALEAIRRRLAVTTIQKYWRMSKISVPKQRAKISHTNENKYVNLSKLERYRKQKTVNETITQRKFGDYNY